MSITGAKPQRCISIAVLCAGLCLGAPARADGDGEGIGPVIGYSGEGSWSIGWEAGLMRGPLAKVSLGGIYHVAPRGDDPFTVHYLVLEPWFVLGGTFGLAVAERGDPLRLAYGVWEGVPIPLKEGVDAFGGDNVAGAGERSWMLTLTLGWRGFGSTQQIYFTPKLWRFAPIGFNS